MHHKREFLQRTY